MVRTVFFVSQSPDNSGPVVTLLSFPHQKAAKVGVKCPAPVSLKAVCMVPRSISPSYMVLSTFLESL
jgi:hypothetical protein